MFNLVKYPIIEEKKRWHAGLEEGTKESINKYLHVQVSSKRLISKKSSCCSPINNIIPDFHLNAQCWLNTLLSCVCVSKSIHSYRQREINVHIQDPLPMTRYLM